MKTLAMILLAGQLLNPHCEVMTGTVLNEAGDGHADWSSAMELQEPYTYIHYRDAKPGDKVVSFFLYGTEYDDVIVRKDMVQR